MATCALYGQDFYVGYVEDVFPFALKRETSGEARFWVGAVDAGVVAREDCTVDGACRFTAVDTALALVGHLTDGRFAGALRDGSGREREVLAEAYLGPRVPVAIPAPPQPPTAIPSEWVGLLGQRVRRTLGRPVATPRSTTAFPEGFLEACGSEKWLRVWRHAGNGSRLTVARLTGGRLAGSLYLGEVGRTVRADGYLRDGGLRLQLTRLDGSPVGVLRGAFEAGGGGLAVYLDVGAGPVPIDLALAESTRLSCRQHAGTLDVLLPGGALDGDGALATYADQEYRRLAGAGESGSVWFEPLRLDEEVLSGFVHIRTDARDETRALTFDRVTGRLVPARRFASGPRRERDLAAVRRLGLAAATHPLRDDPDFRRWLMSADLARVCVIEEGLAYATARHPVYGAVRWVAPWAALDEQVFLRTAELH